MQGEYPAENPHAVVPRKRGLVEVSMDLASEHHTGTTGTKSPSPLATIPNNQSPHNAGLLHTATYESLAPYPTATETYYCNVCNTTCPIALKDLHRSTGQKCIICCEQVHIEWYEQHVEWHLGNGETIFSEPIHAAKIRKRNNNQLSKYPPGAVVPEIKMEGTSQSEVLENETMQVKEDVGSGEVEMEDIPAYIGQNTSAPTVVKVSRYGACGFKLKGDEKGDRMHQTQAWECKVCEKVMHMPDMRGHIAGFKHFHRLKELEEAQARRAAADGHDIPASTTTIALRAPEERSTNEGVSYCEACGMNFIPTQQSIAKHRRPLWECYVCVKMIYHTKRGKHEAEAEHKRNKEIQYRRAMNITTLTPATPEETHRTPTLAMVPAVTTHVLPHSPLPTAAKGAEVGSREVKVESEKSSESEQGVPVASASQAYSGHDIPGPPPPTTISTKAPQKRSKNPGISYCEACGVNFRPTPEAIAKHNKPLWECYICAKMIYHIEKEVHETDFSHMLNQKLRKKGNGAIKPRGRYKGRPAADSIAAPESEPAPSSSAPPAPPGKFYCELCRKNFKTAKGAMKIHKTPAWLCTVCDIAIHIAWKDKHIKGDKHRKNHELQKETVVSLKEQGDGSG